jgi:signal transduction histidine kinase
MKEFAHPDQREKSPSDLNKALQTTLTIARNEYKYVAEAEVDFGELPMVMCHISDLNQVFLNLLVNAAHAISDVKENDGDKGIIRARTRQCGNDVRIEISDTGCGIPEEIQGRVFDPFFTTKEVGRGSGQGLAIARSIVVDKHGGSLTFESEVGKGTTFIVLLPIFDGPFSEDDHLEPKPDSILS